MPSRVRERMRSASNSATIARTLNSSRPTGSVGSYTDAPRLRRTLRLVRSSAMAGASVELGDHERVTGAAGGQGFPQARPFPVGSGQSVIDVDPRRLDAEGRE